MFKWININQYDKKKVCCWSSNAQKIISIKKEFALKPTRPNLFCELNCDSTKSLVFIIYEFHGSYLFIQLLRSKGTWYNPIWIFSYLNIVYFLCSMTSTAPFNTDSFFFQIFLIFFNEMPSSFVYMECLLCQLGRISSFLGVQVPSGFLCFVFLSICLSVKTSRCSKPFIWNSPRL